MTKRLQTMAEKLKEAGPLPELPSRDALLRVLGEQALDGHVPAIRLMLEELRRDADSDQGKANFSEFDELAQRRVVGA